MSNRNEKLLFLSYLADECGRYKDMVSYMEEFVKSKNEDLSLDERNLLFNAYKGRIWSNYQVLVKLSAKDSIGSKKGEDSSLNYIREYKGHVDKDAEELCYKINNFIDENVIPKSQSDESKSFYYYNKASYWKFLFNYGNNKKKRNILKNA
jgi:14-3-3 protein epsilon